MMAQQRLIESLRQARQRVGLERPSLENLAIDLGLRRGRTDYTRFILLGRSRTGSNYLRGLLTSHPGIRLLGEIFRSRDTLEWGADGYPDPRRLLALYRSDPIGFLERHVFRSLPAHVQAFGFKIFYYHAQTAPLERIWDHLRLDRELRVVHVKRRNILRTHLSRARAARSDRWVQLSHDGAPETPITLEFEACRQDFERTRLWEHEFDEYFAGHPILDVAYEELAQDYQGQAVRLQGFLGVEPRALAPQTFRQSSEPLPTAIVNYDELKRRFRGTEWAAFFED